MIPRPDRVEAWLAAALAVAGLAACASNVGTVVLLPEKEGRETSVVVRQGKDEVVLAQPYEAAQVTTSGLRPAKSSALEVQERFGPALAAQPARPVRFTLYFVEGTDNLTEDSRRLLQDALSEIRQRPVPDVVVVGHTDSVGSDAVNDALARRRAEAVRTSLIGIGIAPENVVAAGRGKRELAVPTADNVAEPRNRRVEIFVR